ncbi:ABC transporter substrate-binding protein [Paenibacillus tyrfis]|uniref:ABC transporter substrate-binding protein n=1 Tax=Paenibacillus tyrfis TaxID=1501230 RepID=A0A081P9B3_9BACL|nr:extracellular solute-binding protein [Paenibacillus tyrfis]KEQ27286.1 ABC transporter substrate-binding protein [Paenibacillus tyrfis]
MNKYARRTVLLSLSAGLLASTLTACTKTGSGDGKSERVLRIATSDYVNENEYFRQQFTELFEFANPNIKLEYVSTLDERFRYSGSSDSNEKPKDPIDKLSELMTGDNSPDVVLIDYDHLPELVGSNLLKQLDQDIAKDKFDTSDIAPPIIEGIRRAGDGKIYALAPTFESYALIYNKKLFDEAGVPYPADKMTWDQTFDLARRLSKGEGENRKFGFAFSTYSSRASNLSYGMLVYTEPLQLSMIDDNAEKMTVDSDQWEKVWKTLLQLKTEKLVPQPSDDLKGRGSGSNEDHPFQDDNFLSGRVAMSLIDYRDVGSVANVMKNAHNFKGLTPFDWDMVTMPVHLEAPENGYGIRLDGLMGISAKAQNPEDAWKFIKFVNGEDWARLKGNSSGSLMARQKYIKPKDGAEFNIKAFTTLLPAPAVEDKLYRKLPNLYQVRRIGNRKLQDVSVNILQVREALKQWQSEGDALLQKMKDNPNASVDH